MQFAFFLAAAVLYACGVLFCNLAREDANLIHITLLRGVDAAAAEEIFSRELEEEDPVGFCFWGERTQQTVSCEETGAFSQVTQVLLSGNPELMGAGCLAWQNGCLIDRETAQALFGTVHCGGQTLWHNGMPYPVLGTVSALRPTMLILAGEGDGAVLSRCVLSGPAEKGNVVGEPFLMRWSLQGTVVDFFPVWALTNNLLLLFPGILLLAAMCRMKKRWSKLSFSEVLSGRQVMVLVKRLFVLALATGLLCLLGSRLIIPQNMIPSRWSDFSFWGNWWEGQRENLLNILFLPVDNRQLQMLLNMVKSMGNSIASGLLALWAVRRRSNADIADRG